MKSFTSFVPFCALSLQLQPALAFWRMACSVSQTSRIDPILSPNTVSGHVHKFAGGSNVDQSSTHQSLLESTCSTCEVQSDKSAYWTPQLYYQHSDGIIEEVQNDGMTVYYVGRGGNSSNTVPFPDGFKMISGNSLLRHYDTQNLTYLDTRPIADRVSFRCINEANNVPETHYINDTNCVNGLRAQINFQSCWDGVNLYKEGNTHVAYLSGIDYGVCPPTHPVPIPGLFFEVLYWSNRINQSQGGRFVFSNGDTTGYGFHGDFLNGWDQAVQTQAVQDCLYNNIDSNGVVSACSALAPSDNTNFARICPESAEVMPEAIKGTLPSDQLPGCNPITSGPTDATQVICALNSTTPVSGQTSSSSQSAVTTTVSTLSTSSVSFAISTVLITTQTTPSDLSSSILATDSITDSTTTSTTLTSTSIETILTTVTPTVTMSGHSSGSGSFSTFSWSRTGHYSASQSIGGVFVPASSSLSSDSASSANDYTAVGTVTTTLTVTLGGAVINPSTNANMPTSTIPAVLASLTVADSTISISDSTASTESSSSASLFPTTTATAIVSAATVVGPELTTSLSSMPLSAYLSHTPVHTSWSNFSAPWSNSSHPTSFSVAETTISDSSMPSAASFLPGSQNSYIGTGQSASLNFSQMASTMVVATDSESSTTVDSSSSIAPSGSSTTLATDPSSSALTTPFYTGTVTSGTITTLVTVFVPVSADTASNLIVSPTLTSTSTIASSALKKREAENERLKAFVTFRLRGREMVMEKSE